MYCFTTVCFVVFSIYHHLKFPTKHNNTSERTYDVYLKVKWKKLIQVCEEEASHLNVYIHLLNFFALFVGQMMLSIEKNNELFANERFFFLIATHGIRLIFLAFFFFAPC